MLGYATMTATLLPTDKPKRVVKAKKTEAIALTPDKTMAELPKVYKPLHEVSDFLSGIIVGIEQAKKEIADLENNILATQKLWQEEQENHQKEVINRDEQLRLANKREEEEYEYQRKMERKRSEDEFAEKKLAWERELQQRKEEIAAEKKELTELRVRVAAFDTEEQKAVKEAQTATAKELEEKYTNERKLREQEVKSEREILNLKIVSLTTENSRQSGEIQALKAALDEATRQLKDVAVKVIEGRTPKVIDSSEV